jgi:glycerate kinase
VRVAAAVDKFKGTATGKQVAAAVGSACWELGHDCTELPMADGGEGTLEALGGANRTSVVTGPLGDPVNAEWRMYRGTAVIEMARASGLTLIGGAVNNDAMAASTIGTGELIDMALDAGAKKIIVCLGGSATTDGGYGALRAITSPHRLRGVKLLVACDVRTRFLEAAEVFGPQKGASAAQVKLLTGRLQRLAQIYQHDYGVDVREIDGTGAAGGIAGALVALGGRLIPGFDLVADELDVHDVIAAADIVITGEGYLDEQSFEGKVVGGVQEMAAEAGKPVGAIVGDAAPEVASRIEHISLVDDYGNDKAMNEPLWCIERAAATMLQRLTERQS